MTYASNQTSCPALKHLRTTLQSLVIAEQSSSILVDDGEEVINFASNNVGIGQAVAYAPELDGVVRYRVGNAVLQVVYDGPYDRDTAEEIINDTNGRAEEILNG